MERVHNSLPMAVHRKPHKGFHSMGQYLDKRIDPARQKKSEIRKHMLHRTILLKINEP